MNSTEKLEPLATIEVGGNCVTLLGTAHVSRASAEKVKELLETGNFDAVAVELCSSRYRAIVNPDALASMDLFQVIRQGKAPMVVASLALGAYQQRLAEQFGIVPGAEMRAAIEMASHGKLPLLLVDREVGVTLRRIYRSVPWWRRFELVAGLLTSVLTRDRVTEEEVERLKEGDVLETTFAQFAAQAQDLYRPLIDERDRYMAARLRQELAAVHHGRVLVVVGAGHMGGLRNYLEHDSAPADEIVAALDNVPAPSLWPKLFPWLIVALILVGFVIGFMRSPDLGWQLVMDWILINGTLAAVGALIAAAHPLTVVGAFLAAPLTSLNPTIGAGMVTAAIETYLRKPTVGDFSQLRTMTTHLRGWWQNRVTRILLVFLLSTLGSAIGTYVAGFRILDRLAGT